MFTSVHENSKEVHSIASAKDQFSENSSQSDEQAAEQQQELQQEQQQELSEESMLTASS
ncbi:hypothetical protein [Legionella israelensis]|nr:hypothetical protein [Legionella israelensis]